MHLSDSAGWGINSGSRGSFLSCQIYSQQWSPRSPSLCSVSTGGVEGSSPFIFLFFYATQSQRWLSGVVKYYYTLYSSSTVVFTTKRKAFSGLNSFALLRGLPPSPRAATCGTLWLLLKRTCHAFGNFYISTLFTVFQVDAEIEHACSLRAGKHTPESVSLSVYLCSRMHVLGKSNYRTPENLFGSSRERG